MLDTSLAENDEAMRREILGVRAVLEVIYTRWWGSSPGHSRTEQSSPSSSSMSCMQPSAQAGLRYAEWLLRVVEDGKAASNAMRSALAASRDFADKDEIERRWSKVLAVHEAEVAGATSTGVGAESNEQIVVDSTS